LNLRAIILEAIETAKMREKNPKISKIIKINRFIFPYLIGLTFFFLLLESYMYIGFLRKFILVDSRFFLTISIISIILVLYSKLIDKDNKPSTLENFILNLNALFFTPILFFYWIMTVSNSVKYSNYVFATFHFQPQNFLSVVILSLSLFILKFYILLKIQKITILTHIKLHQIDSRLFISGNKTILKKINWGIILMFFVLFLLGVYAVDNLSETMNNALNGFAFICTHLNYTYDDKMRENWGFYYDYMNFVKSYTPLDATILVPPQSNHWLTSGNSGLDRYFLYPRNLLNADVFSIPKGGYDYILIDKGEWYNDAVNWGWPKVAVKAEEIWYIDPGTLKVTEAKKDFDSKDPLNMQAWGLIKVRKDVQK